MSLKENTLPLRGVLHECRSTKHYLLKRWLPSDTLSAFIEQYWHVTWDLQKDHTQHNLPDPSFHLTIENSTAKILAPVTRDFKYTMSGKGGIWGLKFLPGLISDRLGVSASTLLDQTLRVDDVFDLSTDTLVDFIKQDISDTEKVNFLESVFQEYANTATTMANSDKIHYVQVLLAYIKQTPSLTSVDQLSKEFNCSARSIQRLFKHYIGMSPKWLIRKYRIHEAIAILDSSDENMATLASTLGYTDQSHFSHDFKYFTGQSPGSYQLERKTQN